MIAHFKSFDGLDLNLHLWETMQPPKGIVQVVHGLSEHIERYAHVAEFLNRHHYHTIGHDHRGHGLSEGERVFVKDFEEYTMDLHKIHEFIQKRYPNLPHFIFGHSMGGLISVKYLIDFQPECKGIILTGPALKISREFSPILQKVVSFLGVIYPRLKTQKLDLSYISRDPEVIKKSQADPLVYRQGIKAGIAKAMLEATMEVQAKLNTFNYPFMVMQGTADRLVDPEGARMLFDMARSSDKSKKYYEGLYHEIFNEPEKDIVFKDIVEWLDQRSGH